MYMCTYWGLIGMGIVRLWILELLTHSLRRVFHDVQKSLLGVSEVDILSEQIAGEYLLVKFTSF